MISRLTVSALVFAILGAATLTFAAEAQQHRAVASRHDMVQAPTNEIVQLPRVEVIGHRSALKS
jgi:hypothetical protein